MEKRFLDGQGIGLTFGRNADNSSNVQLDVTAVRNGDDDIITASSTSTVNFSEKTIEANTNLAHFPSGNGKTGEDIILDLRTECTNAIGGSIETLLKGVTLESSKSCKHSGTCNVTGSKTCCGWCQCFIDPQTRKCKSTWGQCAGG